MSASYDYSSVDDQFLLAEDRGYVGGGGGGTDQFWTMKSGELRKVYFTTPGPWSKESDHGWWNWREIFAQQGLTGAGELPFGMRAFPVRDQETYVDSEGNRRRRDISASDPHYDQLLALVVPYLNDRDKTAGRKPGRPVRDAVGVSVVEVGADGSLYPKVLTMTANRYRKIYEIISSFRAMNPSTFTLMGYPWMFGFTGEAAAETPILRPLPGEKPIDLPDPHDIPELLAAKRAAVFAFIQQATGVDTSSYAQAEVAGAAEQAAPAEPVVDITAADVPPWEAAPAPATAGDPWATPAAPAPDAPAAGAGAGAPEPEQAPEPPSREEVYRLMTDTRLKNLITKKGIAVKPRTPREELIALAIEHNV
jgi:hypothetical protein